MTTVMSAEVQSKFDNVKVGDVLVGTYSYNVSFVHFFKVIGKTASTLKLQKLEKKNVGGTLYDYKVVPIMNSVDGKPITRRPNKWGYMYENGKYSAVIYLTAKYNPTHEYSECLMD